VLEAKSYV